MSRRSKVKPLDAVPARRGRPPTKNRLSATVVSTTTPEERLRRIHERMTMMYKLGVAASEQKVRALIVSGSPGIGKTYTLEALLNHAKENQNLKYIHVAGGQVTGIELFKVLYEYRKPGNVILMDDSDGVFRDEDTVNLLKAALDTSAIRRISWLSEAHSLKAGGIPNTFDFHGSMIFVSNLDFQAYVDAGTSRYADHMSALMSRCLYLDLTIQNREDILAWILYLVPKAGVLTQRGLSLGDQNRVLAFIEKHYQDLRELSLRTVTKAGDLIRVDPTAWERMASVTLMKNA